VTWTHDREPQVAAVHPLEIALVQRMISVASPSASPT
jgi:hypothetical protein